MHLSQLSFPSDLDRPGRQSIAVFREQILHNRELCDHCFQQVKSIGETKTKTLDTSGRRLLSDGQPLRIEITGHYERTEHGSQEHTPWDGREGNRRFGTCFCQDCGAEVSASSAHSVGLETLTNRGKRIIAYLNRKTRYWCVGSDFAEALTTLKREPDNTGYDAEILAVATAHSLESPTPNVSPSGATAD
jgi:hypothetical protein